MSNYIYLCYKNTIKNLKLLVIVLVVNTTVGQKILLRKKRLVKKIGKEIVLLVGKCLIVIEKNQ